MRFPASLRVPPFRPIQGSNGFPTILGSEEVGPPPRPLWSVHFPRPACSWCLFCLFEESSFPNLPTTGHAVCDCATVRRKPQPTSLSPRFKGWGPLTDPERHLQNLRAEGKFLYGRCVCILRLPPFYLPFLKASSLELLAGNT